MNKIITRLGPSPTGNFLHIGNLRTLLYNYFLAKKNGGKFYIRLEDTDRDRYCDAFLKYIKDTLDWLGIVPDASFWNPDPTIGSFIQSERDYSDKIKYLLDNGFAYYAFDTKDELDNAHKSISNFKYDSTSRLSMKNSLSMSKSDVDTLLSNGTKYVIRFCVNPNIDITYTDAILGDITINSNTLDDKVLLKSDGIGSYHLCNVCDDHDMGITHVLRGSEWIASTPFHILLYKAFNWNMPTFCHLPLIMNPDGKGKLSKRTASKYGIPIAPIGYTDDIGKYNQGWKDLGYEKESFINALALIGWNPGHDKEIMSMDEMINSFSLDRVHKSGARFDIDKAKWINSHYIQNAVSDDYLLSDVSLPNNLSKDQINVLVTEAKKRCTFKKDFKDIVDKLFQKSDNVIISDIERDILSGIYTYVKDTTDWSIDTINTLIGDYSINSGNKMNKILGLLRKTLLYNTQGIDIKSSIYILGKEEVLLRIKNYQFINI